MQNDPQRVKDIFLGALEHEDATARANYLQEACGTNAELRGRVEALLEAHARAIDFPQPLFGTPEREGATMTFDGRAGHQTLTSDGAEVDVSFLTPTTRPDSLGRLGHYEMLQILGQGAFGIVFRAFDEVLQRVVAVKVLAPMLATLSPARKRFLREARSSAAVRHENVVQVYEVGEQPLPYLVMEFIPGETLQQKLNRCGPLDPVEIVRIGKQIAEGLAAAHACDLIHRDIKPANILMEGGTSRAKITDFGLARTADDASISQSGFVAGTPMYMSPEQALGNKIDQRTDLFSLGSVLYQMTCGRPPFRAPSVVAVLKRVAEEEPRPLSEIIAEAPDWLGTLIAKLHAKNPDERFQSAREVADMLADCEAQLKAKQAVNLPVPNVPHRRDAEPPLRGWQKAIWVTAVVLPLLVLAALEVSGVTHLFRGQRGEPINPGAPSEPTTPTANSTDAERKAAEYVLALGGVVQINGAPRDLLSSTQLPKEEFRLTSVNLVANQKVSDTGLVDFKNCKHLTVLALQATPIRDAGLTHFQNCKNLTHLNLNVTRVTDVGVASFKDCKNLIQLELDSTRVNGSGLVHFKDCRNLTHLGLSNTMVGDAGLAHLKDCKNLIEVNLQNTAVTDAGLKVLAALPKLQLLHLKKTSVTVKGLREFQANLPDCKIIYDGGVLEPRSTGAETKAAEWVLAVGGTLVAMTKQEARQLVKNSALPKGPWELVQVSLMHVKELDDITVENLKFIQPVTARLVLHDAKKLTDSGLAKLSTYAGLKDLTQLVLNTTGVSEAGLAALPKFTKLEHLELGGLPIAVKGMRTLRECKLTELTLYECHDLTAEAWAEFEHYKQLQMLSLSWVPITDQDLLQVAKCVSLKEVRLERCADRAKFLKRDPLTEAGVKKLATARPDLRITWDGVVIEPSNAKPKK